MSAELAQVRVDVWLWRARFAKTRSIASRLVEGGGVRWVREGLNRRLEKAAALVAVGDCLVFSHQGAVMAVRVAGLGARRGPPAEARALYDLIEEETNPDIASLD